jgi:hypothetical protein
MRLPPIIFLFFLNASAFAQNSFYQGGSGNGMCVLKLNSSVLSGSPIGIYSGGIGKGESRALKNNFFINGEVVKFYNGSSGRGDQAATTSSYMNGESDKQSYKGGNGRGDYNSIPINRYLTGDPAGITYSGRIGRGENNQSINSYLNGQSVSITNSGNVGRGEMSATSNLHFLSGADATIAYHGGAGRGESNKYKSSSYFQEGNIALNLKLFIEGFYLGGGQMRAVIDPFNLPSTCDAVSVSLYDATFPFNMAYNSSVLVDISGNVSIALPAEIKNHSYYIVINHRNAIETWSSTPVTFTNTVANFNFSDNIHKAFGNNMHALGDGNFAFWSGDVTDSQTGTGPQDGIIESADYLQIDNAVQIILSGYVNEDLTGDGVVEAEDYLIIENNVAGIIYAVRP